TQAELLRGRHRDMSQDPHHLPPSSRLVVVAAAARRAARMDLIWSANQKPVDCGPQYASRAASTCASVGSPCTCSACGAAVHVSQSGMSSTADAISCQMLTSISSA